MATLSKSERRKEMACACIPCHECRGTGNVWFSFSGKYLGNGRCDDLDDLETCDACGGSGIYEMCDECRYEEYEEEELEYSEPQYQK